MMRVKGTAEYNLLLPPVFLGGPPALPGFASMRRGTGCPSPWGWQGRGALDHTAALRLLNRLSDGGAYASWCPGQDASYFTGTTSGREPGHSRPVHTALPLSASIEAFEWPTTLDVHGHLRPGTCSVPGLDASLARTIPGHPQLLRSLSHCHFRHHPMLGRPTGMWGSISLRPLLSRTQPWRQHLAASFHAC